MPTLTAMPRTTLFLLAALLGSLLALPAHAQWKWRDKSGLIQYSPTARHRRGRHPAKAQRGSGARAAGALSCFGRRQ
jgi:hypothetical protein